MGATCQLDWQLGLTRINFNGSCQGTPGAPTWQIWQTHICSHGETDVQHIRTHICSYTVNRDVSVCLSLWSGWCLDFCSFVPSHVHRPLKKSPKEMPVMEGLLCPCELMRSFFCVWHSHSTHSVPANRTETPWRAVSQVLGMCPVKRFLGEAETKTVERRGNSLVQQKKNA